MVRLPNNLSSGKVPMLADGVLRQSRSCPLTFDLVSNLLAVLAAFSFYFHFPFDWGLTTVWWSKC